MAHHIAYHSSVELRCIRRLRVEGSKVNASGVRVRVSEGCLKDGVEDREVVHRSSFRPQGFGLSIRPQGFGLFFWPQGFGLSFWPQGFGLSIRHEGFGGGALKMACTLERVSNLV